MLSITLIIIIITAIVSFTAFSNTKIIDDLIFYPPAISGHNQWYRFFSCALIHADIAHLAFNMWAFYLFGSMLETYFSQLFGSLGPVLYIALYVISQLLCLLPTYVQHKNSYHYRSLGASGAVSAVVFASIILNPLGGIGLLFLPFHIPGFLFAIIYLGITVYFSKRGGDNINHSAHFFGAMAGVGLLLIFCYSMSDFDPVSAFITQVRGYLGSIF